MNFKVGDKVIPKDERLLAYNESKFNLEAGMIYTVKSVENRTIGLEGTALQYYADRFQLWEAIEYPISDDVYVNRMVREANQGRKALEELFRLIPDQMEINDKDGDKYNAGDIWRALKSIKRLEYRVKPKSKRFPITNIGQWSIQSTAACNKIHEDDVQIGCQIFRTRLLKSCLQDMSNNYHETNYHLNETYYYFKASRAGIIFNTSKDLESNAFAYMGRS